MPMTFYMGSRASYGSCWNNVMAATDFVDSYEWKDGRAFDWNEVIPGFNENDAVKKETFYATLNEGLKQSGHLSRRKRQVIRNVQQA